MDHLLLSDDVSVHPNFGIMVVDAVDRYALPVFGIGETVIENERVLVWLGDPPTPQTRELLKRYE